MKIFLIGASGSIGWPLFNFLRKKNFKVIGTYNKNFKKKLLKFKISNSLSKLSNNINHEDVFVLLAAETNVSWVRKNPKKSFKINSYQTIKLIKFQNLDQKLSTFPQQKFLMEKKDIIKNLVWETLSMFMGKQKMKSKNFYLKANQLIIRLLEPAEM